MKRLIFTLLVAALGIYLQNCTAPIIEAPNPFPEVEKIEIAIDFRFAESYADLGHIQFFNDSKGIVSYQWDFGYTNEKGERVTSKAKDPYIFFPENREYVVTLVGIDFRGEEHRVRHWIPVVYRCC